MDERGPPRWALRLDNFSSAVDLLAEAMALRRERALSELEKAGVVHRFEIAWELGWKLLADYLAHDLAPVDLLSPGASIRAAFAAGLIADGDAWMAAGKLRNALSHTYDRVLRDAGLDAIADRFLALMVGLRDDMQARRHAD